MSCRKTVFALVIGIICMGLSFQVMADMSASEKDSSVRKLGVAWNIADDRKMENSGGIYQPEGLDKYMKRYFEQFSAKIDQLVEQNNRLEKKIDELRSAKGNQPLVSQPSKKF